MFKIALGLSGRIDEDITSFQEDNGRCACSSAVSLIFLSSL